MAKKIMIGKCRLCDSENIELRMSHIVPKMFYEYVKRNSITGGIREVNNPNKRVQDGLKVPFLCAKCEELFSKYETYFANKIFLKTIEKPNEFSFASDDDYIRYFLLSIAWRVLKYTVETDKNMLNNFSAAENDKLLEVLYIWRKILFNEEINELKKLQMHLIPTKSLKIFENINGIVSNNVGIDFRTFDNQDAFEYAFTYVKVPYFIFLCTVWGSTSSMKQFKVGNTIKPRISNLPNFIEKVIIRHLQDFNVSKQEISSKQIESIIERSK
ncbi:hypothetical protein [Clostridium botulinum]|uniref:hypothetical protein n=1 Tax=Clostridium botulinum TaxID=1491 RepID=UPI001E5E1F6E|nr:hypothetical protein [Clostridium botulinum]MCD3276624.1 hypothetical protein [Clostridium botulinum C/D]MCD3288210.1 hypothetical protein [Clostridium botulinum C/D]MCD3291787.1 hypothetical protein [Clostridium botulinum C/D]MCD3291791.1 hypothetical protein [Clostridium botulinum C/D]MCD3301767.1 hypothetical protein [Clostridium botulinum C/D]